MSEPIFLIVDLFCGAGGTTTGFAQAELEGNSVAKVIACVNHDPKAIKSHWQNHPDVKHFEEDIRTLYLAELISTVNWWKERNPDANIYQLHKQLISNTYQTSPYTTFKIYEPKEREIFRLPYFPDRITHHAIMNILEPMFVSMFTADTYSCIKGKGIHAALWALQKGLRDETGTTYCLKLDIKKFYPSVDHAILKSLLRKKIKDNDLLWLLDEIIDSAPGLPIGNYLSQYFANFYLNYFDHWLKEVKAVKYYFRYADDIVILSDNKPDLHQLLSDITEYLSNQLNLQVKDNYQIFPVAARGIDFVGYVSYHTHTLLRKSIKKSFAKTMAKNPNMKSFSSYYGWAVHCNSSRLLKKLNA